MGVYKSIYIGPYLIVKDKSYEETVVEYFTKDGVKTNTKFDPNTGEENIKKTKTVQRTQSIRPWNIEVEGFSDGEFFSPEYHGAPNGYITWVSNKSTFSIKEDDGQFNFSFDSFDSEKKSKFYEYYETYFEKMKEMEIQFEIYFGVVSYAH